MKHDDRTDAGRWARLRFAIVGPLLAAPPRRGELGAALDALAAKTWTHPDTGQPVRFGRSTIERWYYQARHAGTDPVGALAKRVRKDAGTRPSMSAALIQTLHTQHTDHRRWSYKLHYDNLAALVAEDRTLGPLPSYATVRRFMVAHGLTRHRLQRRGPHAQDTPHQAREVRSFEAENVHGLWHLDFHTCSRKLLVADGQWRAPHLLAVLDDHSRLICHAQWYWDETAEALVHGLMQAFQKRALPRALLTDNGSAMLAAETRAGLERLGIVHQTTLVQSPYQNGKQEVFFGQVEGRLMAMLEGCRELSLETLNHATQAWVEQGYHRRVHRAIATTPLERYLDGPGVGRDSPSSDELRRAFRIRVTRRQRRSDGTVSLEGRRFEVPSRYRQFRDLWIRYARWDLRAVELVDPRTDDVLCPLYPLDRTRNADGRRRPLVALDEPFVAEPPETGMAPLLRAQMADYAATGLPPSYVPAPARHDQTTIDSEEKTDT
jgi:putative transposase